MLIFLSFLKVFIQIRGTKGKLSNQHLTNRSHPDAIAALNGEESPFKFAPGSTENFTIKGPDVAELIALEVEVLIYLILACQF